MKGTWGQDKTHTVLDEFLHAVGDVKVAAFAGISHVTSPIPPVFRESLLVQVRSIPVAVEDIGAPDEDFTSLYPLALLSVQF